MIGERRAQPATLAGERGRESPGEVVRLRPRVHEEDRIEAVGAGRDQSFREVDGAFVEVAQIRVELAGLTSDGLADPWMAMAHARDVVVGIEVAATVGIDHPHPLGAAHLDGFGST